MKQDKCIQFKNGNINLRIPKEDLDDFKKDQVCYLSELLSWNNCDFIGETYCLSNFETGHTIYNYYMDCCYIFPWRELETLAEGKMVKLYARVPEEYEREIICKDYI